MLIPSQDPLAWLQVQPDTKGCAETGGGNARKDQEDESHARHQAASHSAGAGTSTDEVDVLELGGKLFTAQVPGVLRLKEIFFSFFLCGIQAHSFPNASVLNLPPTPLCRS